MVKDKRYLKRRLVETYYIENEPVTTIVEMWSLAQILRRLQDLDNMGYDYTYKHRDNSDRIDIKFK